MEDTKENRSSLIVRLLEPALLLAGLSLWLYVIAGVHLAGYLSRFHAEPHWFEPSPMRLLAFAQAPVLLTLASALLFWITLDPTIRWFYWLLGCIALWLLAAITSAHFLVDADGTLRIERRWWWLVMVVLAYGIGPVLARFSWISKECRSVQRRIVETSGRISGAEDDLRKLGSEAIQAVSSEAPESVTSRIDASRQRIAALREDVFAARQQMRRIVHVLSAVWGINLLCISYFFAQGYGATRGAAEVIRFESTAWMQSSGQETNRAQLVFTDGHVSLLLAQEGEHTRVVLQELHASLPLHRTLGRSRGVSATP